MLLFWACVYFLLLLHFAVNQNSILNFQYWWFDDLLVISLFPLYIRCMFLCLLMASLNSLIAMKYISYRMLLSTPLPFHRSHAEFTSNSEMQVDKIRNTMPKLTILPANDAYDVDILAAMRQRVPMSLSPSPSPIPRDPIEPEIDPDNMVVPGSYDTDDDCDDDCLWWCNRTKRERVCVLFFFVSSLF